VTAAAVVESADLGMFVHQVKEADIDNRYASDASEKADEEENAIPFIAGERAREFSDLPPELDRETGRASGHQSTTYIVRTRRQRKLQWKSERPRRLFLGLRVSRFG